MKKLKVGINARILNTKHVRGWSRYTIELIHGLLQSGAQLVLFSDQDINQDLYDKNRLTFRKQKALNYLDWEQRILPQMAREAKVDILHCPVNYGLPAMGRLKKVLTIHDAIDKAFYEPKRSFLQKWSLSQKKVDLFHYLSRCGADAVITVSEHAKQDLIKYYGIDEAKVSVVYEAADEEFSQRNIKTVEELKNKYPAFVEDALFYVGGYEERKNTEGLLAAYANSTQKKPLLLGGQGSQVIRGNNIHTLGYVSDDDLASLYFHSFAFIYPSFYEGFGLQAVEAMQMKKPVIVANNTSLREVVAQENCFFDPYNLESITQKINWLFSDADIQKLSKASFERSQFFTWKKCIDQTLKVYEEVLRK